MTPGTATAAAAAASCGTAPGRSVPRRHLGGRPVGTAPATATAVSCGTAPGRPVPRRHSDGRPVGTATAATAPAATTATVIVVVGAVGAELGAAALARFHVLAVTFFAGRTLEPLGRRGVEEKYYQLEGHTQLWTYMNVNDVHVFVINTYSLTHLLVSSSACTLSNSQS